MPAATPIDPVQLEPRTDQTIVSAVREPVFMSRSNDENNASRASDPYQLS